MAENIQQAFSNNSGISENVVAFPTLSSAQEKDGRPLINYIWINKDKAVTDFDAPTCAIELANIKLVLENAARYPEADFNLWIDKKLLDDYSLLALTSFFDEFARHKNIKLRDLQDIPDYANDSFFEPMNSTKKGYLSARFDREAKGSIYSRADYARILVLDHCLETEPRRRNVIYSDIDCPDLRLPEVLPILKKHGIAIYALRKCASNGYIGLAADRECVREQLKILKSRTCEAAHNGQLGYRIFREFLEEINMPFDTWHDKIGLPGLLPKMLTVPEHLSYTPPAKKLNAWKATHGLNASSPHKPPSPVLQTH